MSQCSDKKTLPSSLRRYRPYFSNAQVAEPTNSFVAWLDVMGASSAMQRSHMIAANFVMKLHAAVLTAGHEDTALYPIVDGVYLVTDNPQSLLTTLTNALFCLGVTFLCETEPLHRFIVRGAVAYGPVIHGSANHGDNDVLRNAQDYRRAIILGLPLTNAHEAEQKASPFGIFIHESARLLSQSAIMRCVHWRWWRHVSAGTEHKDVARLLRDEVDKHLDWCLQHNTDILYEPDRIKSHQELARQYFGMLLD